MVGWDEKMVLLMVGQLRRLFFCVTVVNDDNGP
jgi:hypothetical protein